MLRKRQDSAYQDNKRKDAVEDASLKQKVIGVDKKRAFSVLNDQLERNLARAKARKQS